MTPERQKWWDSLPKEERLVRLAIKKEKQYFSLYKSEAASTVNIWDFIKYQKLLIKALRKQIAQYPYRKDTHRVHCPNCWVWIVECYNEPPYCKYCGQKLRWQE